MSVSTASAESPPRRFNRFRPAAVGPMNLKIPITGVVVLLLQGLMTLGAHGTTTFGLTASSDLFRLGNPVLNARPVILVTAGIVAAATAIALDRARRRSRIPTWATVLIGVGFVIAFLTWAGAGRNGVIPAGDHPVLSAGAERPPSGLRVAGRHHRGAIGHHQHRH